MVPLYNTNVVVTLVNTVLTETVVRETCVVAEAVVVLRRYEEQYELAIAELVLEIVSIVDTDIQLTWCRKHTLFSVHAGDCHSSTLVKQQLGVINVH